MNPPRRDLEDPTFDEVTFAAILAIIDHTHAGLRDACLLQSDKDDKAKHIEWYRGGAQCLLGLRGEMEFERQRRLEAARETPERIVEENLKTLERNAANWQLMPPPDANGEL